jgi:hypothetical protein
MTDSELEDAIPRNKDTCTNKDPGPPKPKQARGPPRKEVKKTTKSGSTKNGVYSSRATETIQQTSSRKRTAPVSNLKTAQGTKIQPERTKRVRIATEEVVCHVVSEDGCNSGPEQTLRGKDRTRLEDSIDLFAETEDNDGQRSTQQTEIANEENGLRGSIFELMNDEDKSGDVPSVNHANNETMSRPSSRGNELNVGSPEDYGSMPTGERLVALHGVMAETWDISEKEAKEDFQKLQAHMCRMTDREGAVSDDSTCTYVLSNSCNIQ